MKTYLRFVGALAMISFVAGVSAQSSDLLVTKSTNGGLVFEFVNDAGAVGLNFEIDLGSEKIAQKVGTKNCVSGFAKHITACNVVGSTIKVAIVSSDLSPLQSGQIGRVSISGVNLAKVDVSVSKFEMSSAEGTLMTNGEAFVDQGSQLKGLDSR